MNRIVFPLLILLLLSVVSYGQENTIDSFNFNKSLNAVYQDPDQTIKIASYFFKNANSSLDKAKALYLRSESYNIKGNHSLSIEDLFLAKKTLENSGENYIKSLVLIALAEHCRNHGMHDVSAKYLSNATNQVENLTKSTDKNIAFFKLQKERASSYVSESNFKASLQSLDNAQLNFDALKKITPTIYVDTQNKIAQVEFKSGNIDNAKSVFFEAHSSISDLQLEGSSMEAVTLYGLGEINREEKDYSTSKNYLNKALATKIIEPKTKVEILRALSEVYKQLDSLAASKKYYSESSLLYTALLKDERNVRNLLLSKIEEDQKESIKKDLDTYYIFGSLIVVALVIVLLGYYLYNKKLNKEYLKFEKIIKQIENKQRLELIVAENEINEEKEPKGLFIPSGTKNAILARLDAFEASEDFTNSNMSLGMLAQKLKTNTKYISEIIHTHKNKNFNTYINELRINYIINLMKEDEQYLKYKVSYLAEKSGFSSHSAFTVVFKSITNITPKQFVGFLKKSNKVAS